ncbi:MAG: UDP-N-acetylmuramoyl-L-alanine--D-glutamate ligase [Alphaproteobacteria bacterium]
MSLETLVTGKSFLVLGLGVTGNATVKALEQAGAGVFVWDDRTKPEDTEFCMASPLDGKTKHLIPSDLTALVMSPGIPHTFPEPHPVAAWAKENKLPIIGDIELLMLSQPDRNFIGITGTNGKSTTTALVAHILETAKINYAVGGNLGPAALGLTNPGAGGWYVLEMSSYQLELLDQAQFDVSAFLNLTPDHLERHGDLAGYTKAKFQLLSHLKSDGHAIVCVDQPVGRGFVQKLQQTSEAEICRVATAEDQKASADIFAGNGELVVNTKSVFDLKRLERFPGLHMWQNFAIAYGICAAAGLDDQAITTGMLSYGGLEHRQEYVGQIDNIEFVNDSKGTNPEASEVAIKSYDNIYWIVGGQAKAEGLKPLLYLADRIKGVFLIGASSDRFARELEGVMPFERCETLDVAVIAAYNQAVLDTKSADKAANLASLHNPVILLSPACASWDQFRSFEHRGDDFKAYFETLANAKTTENDI